MACTHEAIKCVNCVKICLKCGEKLPPDFVPGKCTPATESGVKQPEKGEKTATKRTGRKGAGK